MFPRHFETTVYTEQLTVCPSDLMLTGNFNPLHVATGSAQASIYDYHWQLAPTVTAIQVDAPDVTVSLPLSGTNCNFEKEITVSPCNLPVNPPVQLEVTNLNASHGPRTHPPKKRRRARYSTRNVSESKLKAGRSQIKEKKIGKPIGERSEAQEEAIKRRRIKEADKPCTYEGCTRVFTEFWSAKNHLETIHYGIKKYFCKLECSDECPYASAYKCDLERHMFRVHGVQKKLETVSR